MTIEDEIQKWDRKSSSDIEAIYTTHHHEEDFRSVLIRLLSIEEYQSGASWLLKHYLENGNALDSGEASDILDNLNALTGWDAKLHVLQTFPWLAISENQKLNVEHFLRSNLTSENKFVRAWSYNGFYELARRFPEFIEETRDILKMAMRDEAPSVKARIRSIEKNGF